MNAKGVTALFAYIVQRHKVEKTTAPWKDRGLNRGCQLPIPYGGAFVGSLVGPGVGTIVGAVVGLIIGVIMYIITDVNKMDGKSFRENIKDYISDSWGLD